MRKSFFHDSHPYGKCVAVKLLKLVTARLRKEFVTILVKVNNDKQFVSQILKKFEWFMVGLRTV